VLRLRDPIAVGGDAILGMAGGGVPTLSLALPHSPPSGIGQQNSQDLIFKVPASRPRDVVTGP
jgi:hypothetical protein